MTVCRRVLSDTYPLSKYGAKIHKIIDMCKFLGAKNEKNIEKARAHLHISKKSSNFAAQNHLTTDQHDKIVLV